MVPGFAATCWSTPAPPTPRMTGVADSFGHSVLLVGWPRSFQVSGPSTGCWWITSSHLINRAVVLAPSWNTARVILLVAEHPPPPASVAPLSSWLHFVSTPRKTFSKTASLIARRPETGPPLTLVQPTGRCTTIAIADCATGIVKTLAPAGPAARISWVG